MLDIRSAVKSSGDGFYLLFVLLVALVAILSLIVIFFLAITQ